MFILIDDFLDDRLNKQILDEYSIVSPIGFKYLDEFLEAEKCIFEYAAKFFDLSDAIGSEVWSNLNNTSPDWHLDKDEYLFDRTGEFRFPYCSLIYYPLVDETLEGGRLFIDNGLIIKPRSKRLIMMRPDIYHIVEPFSNGNRISIVSCPYNYNTMIQEK